MTQQSRPCPLCRGEGHYVGPKVEGPVKTAPNLFLVFLGNGLLANLFALGIGGLFAVVCGGGDAATSFGGLIAVVLMLFLSAVAFDRYIDDDKQARGRQ